MSTQIPWISPLGLKPAEVEHWLLQMKPGESLTFYALEKGLVDWSTYKSWAMDFYQLSSLNDEYFREPAPMDFWKIIESVANWSPELLPLDQWDGTIFIGCVEPPPSDLIWSFPVQFVLASPTALKNRWQSYHQTSVAPVIFQEELLNANPTIPSTSFELSPLLNDESLDDKTPPPEGMTSVDISSVKKIELGFDIEIGTGPSTPEEFLNQFKTSEPVATESTSAIIAPSSVPSLAPEDFSADSLVGISLDAPPVVLPDMSIAPSNDVAPESVGPLAAAPLREEQQLFATAFNEMKMFFDHSIYMKWDGQSFIPFQWSEGWIPIGGAESIAITVDTPSLFRIIIRTQHSYHGKIMPTPSHENFFKNWGFVGVPDMATAIPLKVHDSLHGVLLSVGPESSVEARVLEHAEKVAGRLQQKLEQIAGPKVA